MRRFRRAIVAVLALALVAGAIYAIVAILQRSETLVSERCLAVMGSESYELATDQAANASLITAISVQRGLPPRAASIALATAMQESKLRNINYGDDAGPDSRGLFQQRPSQGWGTEAQVMDPVYATNAFYNGLIKIPGYETMEITQAAQQVQRSAFPRAYAQHENMGRAFASALTGHSESALTCELRMPEAAGDPAAVVQELTTAFGPQRATVQGRSVQLDITGTQAWAVAHWAVANAKSLSITQVDVGGQTWNREKRSGWIASAAPSESVTITVSAPTT
ncbi:hypothetical protein StoSoilA2_30560 [Arthrobacter sp. StoSoilA2]|uniref:hypothetical protein n=1 Tax=unclassified Arthrobacter TaxID=235627 RepID=UPI001CC47CD2|nr:MULTISPECIES: hypothetical protein [unclassified Arthrobacter]BCW37000.1 hypothetical protein StoSoilA2_30560 [Arthrobacter sp. StoSoilA2]BCW49189.1 hypothetical protein StoSoilB13_15310 [Arthrobacter sp. StoSoilB13]